MLPIDSLAQIEHFNKTDSQLIERDFLFNCVQLERKIFYSDNNIEKSKSLLQKANLYISHNSFKEAASCLSRISFNQLPDSLIFSCSKLQILNYYLMEDFENALGTFQQMSLLIRDTSLIYENLYLKGLVLNELNRYAESREVFIEWVNYKFRLDSSNLKNAVNLINSTFSIKKIPRIIKLDKAIIWASIIPGGGHFYCHAYKEGIINSLLQLSSLTLTGVAIYYGYYATALIVSYGMFNRFRTGAINRMNYLVPKINYQKSHLFNLEVKNIIKNIN